MTYICSAGIGVPDYEISQQEIKELVKGLFPYTERQLNRLLPVFDHAAIEKRQFVVPMNWFQQAHTFQEKNKLYQTYAIHYALQAMDDCLTNKRFVKQTIPFDAIDMIIFISSTGIATPSLDAHLLNQRPFREDVERMPLWGLGCAGGAIGLSRAYDYLTAHPKKTVLIVGAELCSLTFQKEDHKKSNLIGSALFGDGVGAIFLCGNQSAYRANRTKVLPKIVQTSSFTKKDSLGVMGWDITNNGMEVIFSKSIPNLVQTLWKDHIDAFFKKLGTTEAGIHSFIVHPGGKKVLAAMEETGNISVKKLAHSYNVLRNHGNISSATIFYVLNEWMNEQFSGNEQSIVSALGPGFSSELLLLEWGI
ncbi:3-oxoacyl-[acyl-carrier-protein] synthase III C-terminal domain-containing protein [Lentibacillus sp. N15]|uniref:type III polyketide synthase n=1 Tax=Lentibacillus songyuanensis TaxID=3136161 RepID=UPI0031BABB13